MDGKPTVAPEDSSLFRDAVGDVKPVRNDREHLTGPRPAAEPRRQSQDDASVMDELLSDFSETDLLDTGEHVGYTAPGIQRAVLRNLKSGRYAIQSELDLHGLTLAMSREALQNFLREAGVRGHTCVRIIHGRGRKPIDKAPVLKPAVTLWLSRHRRVLAVCSAREADGGTGAVYVLLRKGRS